LDVKEIVLGGVNQQNLEEEVILVDINEGLGVERIKRASQLHQRLEFGDVVDFLDSCFQNIVNLLIIIVEIRSIFSSFPQQSEVDEVIRIFLHHF
jgi:hypothetical protein